MRTTRRGFIASAAGAIGFPAFSHAAQAQASTLPIRVGVSTSAEFVVIYHGIEATRDADACEELLASNGWLPDWRNGTSLFTTSTRSPTRRSASSGGPPP